MHLGLDIGTSAVKAVVRSCIRWKDGRSLTEGAERQTRVDRQYRPTRGLHHERVS